MPAGSLDKEQLRQLLIRCWMTHDAMWLGGAVQTVGIETANALNRAAVRMTAATETRRLRRLIGLSAVEDLDDVRWFFEQALSVFIGDFMEFDWEWSAASDEMRIDMTRCFAFEGVTRLGIADTYECGIYERIYGWLDELGVDYEAAPDSALCLQHHEGRCSRVFRLTMRETDAE